MSEIFAKTALLPDGWAKDVRLTLSGGRIAGVEIGAAPGAAQPADILLTAPANLHSHAFQRAMAGLTEARGPDAADSFWTWRRLMYRFLDHLTPDHVRAIAAFVQMEMLEAGYAAVGEFHYLHHRPDGGAYDDPAAMAAEIAAAAAETGIGLTLLPVLYQQGGVDGRALGPGQVRFGSDLDLFARVMEGAAAALADLPADARLGVAPHSLRAVGPEALAAAAALRPADPIHMHIAEQTAEISEILGAYGARPVAWLLDQITVDQRWCLIHATHLAPVETRRLAESGAVVGLCPITEANLGDGVFDAPRYLQAGGAFGVGSDSNVRISLAEELRSFEYSQRLTRRGRAVLAEAARSTGRRLYDAAAAGGAQALGRASGAIRVGAVADLVALNADQPALWEKTGDAILDGWIFAGDDRVVADVWAAGRHVVSGGRHTAHDAITAAYRQALRALTGAL